MRIRAFYSSLLIFVLMANHDTAASLSALGHHSLHSSVRSRAPANNENRARANESRARAARLREQREAERIEIETRSLREFRGFLRLAYMANHRLLLDAYECLESIETLEQEQCSELKDVFGQHVLPAFHEVRILSSLLSAQGMRAQGNYEFTESRPVFSYWKYKLNSKQRDHRFNMYSEWLPGGIEDDLSPAKLQELSAYEVIQALIKFKRDGLERSGEWNELVNWDERQLIVRQQIAEDPEMPEAFAEYLLSQFEEPVTERDRYIHTKRYEDREEYKERYFDLIQQYPMIAFMEMPESSNIEENQGLYVKNLICREPILNDDKNLLFGTPNDFLNSVCRSEEVPDVRFIRQMSRRPRYLWELEDYLPTMRNGVRIMMAFSEALIKEETEIGTSLEDLLPLMSYDKAFEDFSGIVSQTDTEDREEVFASLEEQWRIVVRNRNLREGAAGLGLGLLCAAGLKRLPLGGRLVGFMLRTFGVAAAGCTLFAGLGINYLLLGLAKNRYYDRYMQFFSSLAEIEMHSDEFASEDGQSLTSRVLISVDELDSEDTDLLFEMLFLALEQDSVMLAKF
jgi:hypothetical protein